MDNHRENNQEYFRKQDGKGEEEKSLEMCVKVRRAVITCPDQHCGIVGESFGESCWCGPAWADSSLAL